ncbi:MAG: TetR/AcrR family transcriptional regulator [Ferruginibacter sp.]
METLVTLKVSVVLRLKMTEINHKDRIRQEARDLVMQYGIRSVSMDDIAAKLGMSKKTIYQFYKDKDELIGDIIESLIFQNQQICIADKQNAENAIHEIFLAMKIVAEMFRSMNPSLLLDLQKYHDSTFRKFLNHKNEFLLNMMHHNIQRGIKEEYYRPEINVEIMALFRVESMFIPFNPSFFKNVKASLLEIEQELIVHFLFGLVTLKGYKMVLKYQEQREKIKYKQSGK